MKHRSLLSSLLVCSLALPGCYAHTPVRVAEVKPGSPVRVRISATEAERLTEVLGGERRVLRGNVVELQSDGLMVRVPALGSTTAQPLAQQVLLSPSEIVDLELRRLDRVRTAGVVAGLTAVGGILLAAHFATSRQGSGDDQGGPNEALIPVLRR